MDEYVPRHKAEPRRIKPWPFLVALAILGVAAAAELAFMSDAPPPPRAIHTEAGWTRPALTPIARDAARTSLVKYPAKTITIERSAPWMSRPANVVLTVTATRTVIVTPSSSPARATSSPTTRKASPTSSTRPPSPSSTPTATPPTSTTSSSPSVVTTTPTSVPTSVPTTSITDLPITTP